LTQQVRHEKAPSAPRANGDAGVSTVTFALSVIGIQGAFVLLDLFEWHRGRPHRDSEPPETIGTWLFLLAVIGVFFALQYGGYSLAPSTRDLLVSLRSAMAGWFGLTVADAPMSATVIAFVSVAAFYVSGLWDYLIHRFFSHNRWFFFTHEYHHLPRQVSCLMPGIAGRPFAVFAVFPTVAASIVTVYALLAACRLPLWDLSALKILFLTILAVQVTSHSSFMRRQCWLHRLLKWLAITSPQEHVLHHTADLSGNYGNFTTLWDRLFGTYLDPTRPELQGHKLGLPYDQDFLGTLTLGRFKLSARWRQRFAVRRYCNLREE
jgi:sterol desaturase/sphingolipid hydroxylase (fatty acid hydroxylase superfamily)